MAKHLADSETGSRAGVGERAAWNCLLDRYREHQRRMVKMRPALPLSLRAPR
jgi:hypothetical protein